ncbi:c-type cytochrome [Bacteroidota bacterium]
MTQAYKIQSAKFSFSLFLALSVVFCMSCSQNNDDQAETTDETALVTETETATNVAEEDVSATSTEAIVDEEVKVETQLDKEVPKTQAAVKTTTTNPVTKEATETAKQEIVSTQTTETGTQTTQETKTVEVVKEVKEVVRTKAAESSTNGWDIPAKYLTMKNSVPASKTDMALGKSLYDKQCKSCHGATGKGDGPKAMNLDTKIRSLRSAEFKAQKPGVIYYKSYVGRDEMPNFEKKILDEEDRWTLVNYMLSM